MDVSIVILNFKSKGLVMQCIKTLKMYPTTCSVEIVVADSGSGDDIAITIKEKFPEVKLVLSPQNKGYAAGNNLGITAAIGRYILILNPDITVRPGSIDALVKFMDEHQDVGLCGPKLLRPNGETDESCYCFHRWFTPIFRRTPLGRLAIGQKEIARFTMVDFSRTETCDVDWLLGAVLMMRRSAMEKVGLLDEKFFLYFEDTDWCRRFWQAGYRVVYFVNAIMVHCHERLSAQTPWFLGLFSSATRAHIRSCFYYFQKWGTQSVTHDDFKK